VEPTSQLHAGLHGKGIEEIGDLLHWRRVNSGWMHQLFGGAVLATHSLVLVFVVGAFLGAADTFGAGSLFLAFLLIFFTGAFLGAAVISVGVDFKRGECWALATRPPRSTWFHPSPRLTWSGDGWGRLGALRTSPVGSPLLVISPQVPALQEPLLPPSISCNPGIWRCGYPRRRSIQAALWG
jgi:hypothetical protein